LIAVFKLSRVQTSIQRYCFVLYCGCQRLLKVSEVRKFVKAQNENRSAGKRKRSAKISPRQYQIYLEELQDNEAVRLNKFNPKNPDILDETWNSLTLKLNAAGGPIKTVQQWKEVSVLTFASYILLIIVNYT
jgi:hypothetical protein